MELSFDLLLKRAVDLHDAFQLDEAENIYRQLLEISPQNDNILNLIGLIACQKGAFDSALEYLYKAIKYNPENFNARFTLAQTLCETNRPKEALEQYKILLDKNPDFADTYHNIGVIYKNLNEIEKAKDFFEKALEKNNNFALAKVNLSIIHRDENNYSKAIELLNAAIENDANCAEAYYQLAITLRNQKEYKNSYMKMAKAIEIEPANYKYLNGMGIICEYLSLDNEALSYYTKSILANEFYPDAYNNRANIYVKLKEPYKAENDFKKAIKLDPKFVEPCNNLGALLYNQERFEEALEYYRKAFIINPKMPQTCLNLAIIVKQAGDIEEAISLLFRTLSLDQSLNQAHFYLSEALYHYATVEKQLEMAIKLCKKWIEFFPDNPIAKHTLNSLENNSPEQADKNYIRQLFDSFADNFEKTLKKLDYSVPDLIEQELTDAPSNLTILDAGCGTGLLASKLKPHALELIGIDISENMILKAEEKNLYSNLYATEITDFLKIQSNQNRFDIITFADVMCYFGNLQEVLTLSYNSLDNNGLLLFTIETVDESSETNDSNSYKLSKTGRYQHNPNKIKELLNKLNFEILSFKNCDLRTENQNIVKGMLIKAKKSFINQK
ncbi:MAG: tetratricopeptide repeat protein [Alphaproteobacteria bacterium]|nr:tetratricopeptide repeat protein [Alphaproteobacteria bacterium]